MLTKRHRRFPLLSGRRMRRLQKRFALSESSQFNTPIGTGSVFVQDSFEDYANNQWLAGSNSGAFWNGPWLGDRGLMVVTEDWESYVNGVSVGGCNAGNALTPIPYGYIIVGSSPLTWSSPWTT